MKNTFKNRGLSKTQAEEIANSQKDLGGISQKDMVITLNGSSSLDDRQKAYDALDPLSKFIVNEYLGNGTIEEAQQSIGYAIDNLTKAKDAIGLDW